MTKKILETIIYTAAIYGVCFPFTSSPSRANTHQDFNENFGLELHYFESSFGCGEGQIDIDVKVYKDNQLIQTMSKGDRYLLTDIDSINDLSFEYHSDDPEFYASYCRETDGINHQILGNQDPIPSFAGAHSQQSLQQMMVGLNSYEELYLVELATRDRSSEVFDLQDVIIIVDHNPELPNSSPVANDDTATVGIYNSVTIDVLANDTDPEGDATSIFSIDSVFGGEAIVEDNKIVYTADSMPGEFSLTYTVQDVYGKTDSGTVIITVTAFPD
ncbi:MAG: Ig-like domain-containing protein [Cyanobacteria bacterium J06598_4]